MRKPYKSDLTDAQWAVIAPLLPAPKPGGRPRTADPRDEEGLEGSNGAVASILVVAGFLASLEELESGEASHSVGDIEAQTDLAAVSDKAISITPLQVDMTAHAFKHYLTQEFG